MTDTDEKEEKLILISLLVLLIERFLIKMGNGYQKNSVVFKKKMID